MSYYHVLLGFQDEPQTVRCLLSDLSEKELQIRFVTPYRRGKNILCGSEVVEVSRIRTVRIVRTADASETELKRMQEESRKQTEEFNRSSRSVVFFGLDRGDNLDDISDAGEDVTSTFIAEAPGHGDRWTVVAAVLNQMWVYIGAAVIVAALLWWLGLNCPL